MVDAESLAAGKVPRRKGDDIAERLEAWAAEIVDGVLPGLDDRFTARHVARQLARGATSAGANYEEARGAESRADFSHKVLLAAKELREARYWIRLLGRSHQLSRALRDRSLLQRLEQEADELVAILIASAKTARRGAK